MQKDLYRYAKARRDNEFIDYPAEQIQAKLKQIHEFEAKYGEKPVSKSWQKWCPDYEYRKREWQWRHGVAVYACTNAHKILQTK